MKSGQSKSKSKKVEARKKRVSKQPPATGDTGTQGTADTIRRWVETLDRLSRTTAPMGLAVVLSQA